LNTPPDHSVTTPDKAATPHWKAQAERSNAFWVQLLARLALFFGRTFILGLLHPIVLYFFLTGGSAKNASREALFRFTGKQPSQWAVFRHLYTFALVAVGSHLPAAGRAHPIVQRNTAWRGDLHPACAARAVAASCWSPTPVPSM
jgi:hypothetical protein